MTLGELFEETYIQGEIAIRSYDSTGTTIEHYLGDAEEFYPDEHPQILEREVGYIRASEPQGGVSEEHGELEERGIQTP